MGTGEDSHPTDLSVSDAAAVFAAYERNEVQADNQIKGKWLAIKGSVNKIGKDILDTPYVALSTKSHIFSVQCMFTKADENILSQLQPEQIVVIAGKCDGKMGNVLIRQCWFYDADRKQREEAQRQAAIRQQAAIERAQAEKERKAAIEAAKWRTWTDASGAHKMEAKFSGMTAGNVKLTKRDGSVLTLPLEKLSDEDQEWIKKRK